ncbi:MAG: ATP-binding protein [Candidatus Woesearchaeota archaeon]|jgi:hypothetical protein|nr:ATP-binding protein [Candidatus Woesearchaeota archaeon]
MDTFLKEAYYIPDEWLDDDDIEPAEKPAKIDVWVEESGYIRPSPNLSIAPKLVPNLYTISADRMGYFCQRLNIVSDELFVLPNNIIASLIDEINLFWEKKDLYKEHNLIHKRGILLEGFPGTGKSSIISLLSKELISRGGIIFKVTNQKNLIDYVNFLRFSFREIEKDTPIITIIEDIDKYEDEETLLDFLDGKSSIGHHVVIATSNNTSDIANTFLRPSRLDLHIEIPLPDKEVRKQYFIHKKVDEGDIDSLVNVSDGMSLADLKEIYTCITFLNYSIKDAVDKIKNPSKKKNYTIKRNFNKKIGV